MLLRDAARSPHVVCAGADGLAAHYPIVDHDAASVDPTLYDYTSSLHDRQRADVGGPGFLGHY